MNEIEIKKILKTYLKHKDKQILFKEFRDMFMNFLLPVHVEEFTEKRKKEENYEIALSEKISDGNIILEEDEEDE